MDRRSFIGVLSSLFAFGFSTKSKATPKPLYGMSEYGWAMMDNKKILSSSFEDFKIIEDSIIIDKNRGIIDSNGNFKWIWVHFSSNPNIGGMFVPLSGCTEEDVQESIKVMKKSSKKFYICRLYDENGNLLNCIGSETPVYA